VDFLIRRYSKLFESWLNSVKEGMSSDKIHVMNKSIVIKRSVLKLYVRARFLFSSLSLSFSFSLLDKIM
jgi:hypothetical protein